MLYFKSTSAMYQTTDSVGFDIECSEDVSIEPNEFKAIATGLFLDVEANREIMNAIAGQSALAIPELQIRPRSGLAARHGVTVLNSPGTIDPLYPNEIKVILINLGSAPVKFDKGTRIAQGVICLTSRAQNIAVLPSERSGGFGSTGV